MSQARAGNRWQRKGLLGGVALVLSSFVLGPSLTASEPATSFKSADPIFTAQISARFIKDVVVPAIDESDEFTERILRAEVHSVARSHASVDVELREDSQRIVIDLVARG